MATMCVCGENQAMDLTPTRNVFMPHNDPKTGTQCPGLPLQPIQTPTLSGVIRHRDEVIDYARATSIRCTRAENLMMKHSMFAYPHVWLWHALFDGTWLCRCWYSQRMKDARL